MPEQTSSTGRYTAPGLAPETAQKISEILQERLNSLTDLHLTLKHIHWNVVGPNFIAVHEMLDTQVDAVREMADEVAERIATLGHTPVGTPGAVASGRTWKDYSLGRATTSQHLAGLDLVYNGVVSDHRRAFAAFEELDLVTQDILVEQTEQLEQLQWFVRAHLEDGSGRLAHAGATTPDEAAARLAGGLSG